TGLAFEGTFHPGSSIRARKVRDHATKARHDPRRGAAPTLPIRRRHGGGGGTMTRTIGRFEIRRELGRGAQSVVHLAWDPQLEREVALKALHLGPRPGHDNASLLAEARAVSRLRHPGIVPVFEAG